MFDKKRNKFKQCLCYKLEQWNKIGSFDILNNISEHITWVQFIESIGNVNNVVSVVGRQIFNSNYENFPPF